MSAKLDIFNDIVTEIKKISDIETVGLWNNQFANESQEFAFNFPALFIEFAEINWSSTSQNPPKLGSEGDKRKEQKGAGTLVMLHLGFSQFENETISFPIISPIIDKVYFKIQLLQGTFYSPLLRVSETQDTDHDRVIDWQMGFGTKLDQCGELDTGLTKIVGGTLGLDVNVDLDIDDDKIRSGDGTV